jgi:hypothetical protein
MPVVFSCVCLYTSNVLGNYNAYMSETGFLCCLTSSVVKVSKSYFNFSRLLIE